MSTTTNTTCNGWSNYATWRVNLEIVDDYIQHSLAEAVQGDIEQFNDVHELKSHLEGYVETAITSDGRDSGLAIDYALAFLSTVNWYELAEHAAQDYPQLIATDDDEDIEIESELTDEQRFILNKTFENLHNN